MDWNETVQKDFTLSRAARQLANVIVSNFGTLSTRHCSFFDNSAAGILGTTSEAVRQARYELERKGYLHELQYGTNKPSYSLRLPLSMANSDGEAA